MIFIFIRKSLVGYDVRIFNIQFKLMLQTPVEFLVSLHWMLIHVYKKQEKESYLHWI